MNKKELFEQWLVDRGYSFFPEEEWVGFQAGYDTCLKELSEQEPVAWMNSNEHDGESFYGHPSNDIGQIDSDFVPLIPRPTIKGESK